MRDKEKKKEYQKQYFLDNKEKINEQRRQWNLDNKEKLKQYRLDNKEKINKRRKQLYLDNKEKFKKFYLDNKEKLKQYRLDNKEKIKQYRLDNKEKSKQYQKQWNLDNKEKSKQYYLDNKEKINKKSVNYNAKKMKTDSLFKLSFNLRTRIRQAVKSKGWIKQHKTAKILGCDFETVKKHLENQFTLGMNWENHGLYGWHIDHIKPLSKAETEKELYKRCHYTNLQPLWAADNLSKGAKEL